MLHLITSTSAAARLNAAAQFLSERPPALEVLVVGASRGAADDFVRAVAMKSGATFGLTRFSLTELAARAATLRLAASHRIAGTQAGAEATAARAVFASLAQGELHYFTPVAAMPGFPKALARTLHELRLAGFTADRLSPMDPGSRDLASLLTRVETQLQEAGVVDRAALFSVATGAWTERESEERGGVGNRWIGLPIVLLDVPLDSDAERAFVAALVERSPEVLATAPGGDEFACDALLALGAQRTALPDTAAATTDLASLRRHIFTSDRPPARARTGDVCLFSAPGEGREAVEIVRRVLDEAARGVPFDEMAVLLRAPRHYVGLLEHACARAGVPVYFDSGTRRPDPAGRAFLALLSCACEGLSAKRFDEYLSLGQVPQVPTGDGPGRLEGLHYDSQTNAPREAMHDDGLTKGSRSGSRSADLQVRSDELVLPGDEVFAGFPLPGLVADQDQPIDSDSDDDAVVDGTLRAPWRWEELIVESSIIAGRTRADGKARWHRRLDGLAADYRFRIEELERDEPESPRLAHIRRDLRNLAHLRVFALPIVDILAAWPERATWGEWLDCFVPLASRALKRPLRVERALADLRPMAEVGPVSLREARDVLQERLANLDWEQPAHRYGRLFVGTPHQARGRTFRVVLAPGLAERIVPQRPREDPLLLDERRRALGGALVGQEERGSAERLLLKIVIGAARERLYLSYPRLDVAEMRPRVPSFYALDVVRAMTGVVPDHRVLAAEAAEEAGAHLAWPAPADPEHAIDDLEHDLASLKPLLDSRSTAAVKGRAHYLLGLNDALRRSVSSRWTRGRPTWASSDGLIAVTPGIAAALDAHRLRRRPYSLSALQRFATCPYQFLLATIHRLQPWDEPEPLLRMDPMTRGSLFHRAQAEFYRALHAGAALPITPESLAGAMRTLDEVLDRVAAEYAESLAPAIERVWRDEIAELRRDLGIWVQKQADGGAWKPEYFEFSFGLNDEGRDPRSLPDPIVIDGGFMLRGSVDLVEVGADAGVLRVTDHKTGKDRSRRDMVVGGGSVLQPVLYSVAVEHGLGKPVTSGRLFYCTTAGGFTEHEIKINATSRAQATHVLEIIDRSIELGFLVAAPAENACTWCDFRSVCGPHEEERVKHKAAERLADLKALREMP